MEVMKIGASRSFSRLANIGAGISCEKYSYYGTIMKIFP